MSIFIFVLSEISNKNYAGIAYTFAYYKPNSNDNYIQRKL